MAWGDKFGTGQGWLAQAFGKGGPPVNNAPQPNQVQPQSSQGTPLMTAPSTIEQVISDNTIPPNISMEGSESMVPSPVEQANVATEVNPYSMSNLLSDTEFNKWGTSTEDLNTFMDKIAYHESGGSMDPGQQQWSGGPGRGLFQYEQTYKDKESGEYGQAGGMTARNRLASYYEGKNMEVPDWLTQEGMSDPTVGFDASKLTDEQQRMLFLADKRYNPDMGSGLTQENISDVGSYWGKHHWAGADVGSDAYAHEQEKFSSSLDAYNQNQIVDDTMASNDRVESAFKY